MVSKASSMRISIGVGNGPFAKFNIENRLATRPSITNASFAR
jgi:hypothetical protein